MPCGSTYQQLQEKILRHVGAHSPSATSMPAHATAANWKSTRSTTPITTSRDWVSILSQVRATRYAAGDGARISPYWKLHSSEPTMPPRTKLVVAVGDCGCTGGIFGEGYAICGKNFQRHSGGCSCTRLPTHANRPAAGHPHCHKRRQKDKQQLISPTPLDFPWIQAAYKSQTVRLRNIPVPTIKTGAQAPVLNWTQSPS